MQIDGNKMTNYIQFENWTADQVGEWLKGLDMDDVIIPYMHYFLNGNVDGKKLFMMTHSDLEKLNVVKLGHQELILEAIDLLRNLRYGYESENLQSLALQLGCKARSLNAEMRVYSSENDKNMANVTQPDVRPRRLSIGILSYVADLISTLKSLVTWMDRPPFSGLHDLCLVRNTIVKLGLDLIGICQKENPNIDVEAKISNDTKMLADVCDELVIGTSDRPQDPLFVQPASLEVAPIRKKPGEELGMHIQSTYYGTHVISGIKDMSPADLCGKIEKGDEVIQVNYQTVVGWQLKKLVNSLKENPKEVILLLKKRPRHSPHGQIPNKKKQMNKAQVSTLPKSLKKLRSRDGDSKQLRPSLQEFVNSVPADELYSPKEALDGNDTDNEVFRSGSESPQYTLPVQVDPKQRRATVSGGSPTLSRPLLVIEDLDTPTRPKSFTIASMDIPRTEIVINSPPEDDKPFTASGAAAAVHRRQEFKETKSTPSSLEFTVRKVTPRIQEPKPGDTDDSIPVSQTTITIREPDSDNTESTETTKTPQDSSVQSDESPGHTHDHTSHTSSPEHLHDSSTDSVPPSLESSIESSQTCTSSLESSSHSPPLEESSISSEPGSLDLPVFGENTPSSFPKTFPQNLDGHYVDRPEARKLTYEVPWAAEEKSHVQLVKIRKIESMKISDVEATKALQVEGEGGTKTEKKVGFEGLSDKDSDDSQSYTHIVVGGVVQKIPVKGSPSESPVVRRRPKTGRNKRVDRRVSCKDLGKGDCNGWLFKKRDRGGGPLSSKWQKRWCVLKNHNLFYYKAKDDLKAEGVIHLPAFQVSPIESSEIKTKKFAFKVHNAGTSFYFASERQDDMSKWMNKMGLAAIAYIDEHDVHKPEEGKYAKKHDHNDFYSESDEEDGDSPHPKPSLTSMDSNSSLGSVSSLSATTTPTGTLERNSKKKGSDKHLDVSLSTPAASTEDLTVMYRKIERENLTFDGKDRDKQRRSALSSKDMEQVDSERFKKKTALERTLMAKQKELEEIESILHGKISPEKLHQFADQNMALSTSPGAEESDSA